MLSFAVAAADAVAAAAATIAASHSEYSIQFHSFEWHCDSMRLFMLCVSFDYI